jgi:hypothetical protein
VKKTDLAHAVALRGGFPVKRVAEAFDVSRSQLSERLATGPRNRPLCYSKARDEVLLPLIREIVDGRLTYGYRRVCALLNRRLVELGQARVNHNACTGSCGSTVCFWPGTRATGPSSRMKARSSPCGATCVGARMLSRSAAGTARRSGWPLLSTAATARSWVHGIDVRNIRLNGARPHAGMRGEAIRGDPYATSCGVHGISMGGAEYATSCEMAHGQRLLLGGHGHCGVWV